VKWSLKENVKLNRIRQSCSKTLLMYLGQVAATFVKFSVQLYQFLTCD